ncbi:ribosome silencing factor [Aquisalinus flavus]|uniref:Ribosomal silencing factor RsfS n=1 Tax=Aquisalinus flavus TaxID=1526572 RepID=A0A8J2V321_9PROT|nr:ribosome silencing factor [Aquisalinus flavus]MBD0425269.1 ribosome silencing factor [Aquisalinus flavus]UNE49077.1 ribosome silencing factor [Aquisalinus flavus]GGD17402.1 ribosomal silencing factor RsfS [Aquisalinus flavus]
MALISQSSQAARPAAPASHNPDAADAAMDVNAGVTGKALVDLILSQLDDDKAEDVTTIDLTGKSDIADAMIIASGRSQRHVGALADHIARELKDAGKGTPSMEGLPACDWVLIDAGDVIVHLFRPEVRAFYNLERIWSPEAHADAAAARAVTGAQSGAH